jgi:hypothetical protein
MIVMTLAMFAIGAPFGYGPGVRTIR